MNEWLLVRFLILGVLVGGGVLFALAGIAFDRWRERRAHASGTRMDRAVAAKYPANLTHLYRWRERRAHAGGARQGGASSAKNRTRLTQITAPRSFTR